MHIALYGIPYSMPVWASCSFFCTVRSSVEFYIPMGRGIYGEWNLISFSFPRSTVLTWNSLAGVGIKCLFIHFDSFNWTSGWEWDAVAIRSLFPDIVPIFWNIIFHCGLLRRSSVLRLVHLPWSQKRKYYISPKTGTTTCYDKFYGIISDWINFASIG